MHDPAAQEGKERRLLFLMLGSYIKPDEIQLKEKFEILSRNYRGDIVAIVGKKEWRHAMMGAFDVRGLYLPASIRNRYTIIRDACYALYCLVAIPYRHYFKKRYDAIVAQEPIATGPLSLILSRLTGARSIVFFNGNYESSFKVDERTMKTADALKMRYSGFMIPFVLRHADGVKLLYPRQVSSFYDTEGSRKVFSFGEFVPIKRFACPGGSARLDDGSILFIGFPWYLKGVDILIKAFNKIYKEFPGHTLKIVGLCSDRTEYEKLAAGNKQIEFCKQVWYEEVVELMSKCSLFVLPSRTEAMGRVLVEAMASRKPVIGSNVDGIPYVVEDGKTGLLFQSENFDDLAAKMKRVLSDREFAMQLGENGYQFVKRELSEERYLEKFSQMVEQVLAGHNV
jgi:glycosyltransferase involved in cell wall biosynthesis